MYIHVNVDTHNRRDGHVRAWGGGGMDVHSCKC